MHGSQHIALPADPAEQSRALAPAADAVRQGALVVFPTETVYGIAVRADNQAACMRLRTAKKRPDAKPFAFHVGSWDMARRVMGDQPPSIVALLEKFLPGPFTFLLDVAGETHGLRFPESTPAQVFLDLCAVPVAATSANISGEPSPTDAAMTAALWPVASYVIDGGPTALRGDSTVVDLTVEPPRCVRCGIAPWPRDSRTNNNRLT